MRNKKCGHTGDHNIESIQTAGNAAIEMAILDYMAGNLAIDPFEQIGRVLYWMQSEFKKESKKKKKPKPKKTKKK